MRPHHGRFGVGLGALAGLWIAIYWWWDPSPEPAIRFAAPEPPPDPAGPDGAEPATSGGSPPVQAAPDPVAQPVAEPAGVLPPDFWDYTIEEGEQSLQDVALKFFGDAEAWVVIAQSNPLKDPARVAPGQVWRLPVDPGNLQGVLVNAQGQPIERAPSPPAPKPEEFIEYVVQAGDSLSLISQRLYGTQKHADLLYQLNRERLALRSIDAISVGQTLRAPKSPGP